MLRLSVNEVLLYRLDNPAWGDLQGTWASLHCLVPEPFQRLDELPDGQWQAIWNGQDRDQVANPDEIQDVRLLDHPDRGGVGVHPGRHRGGRTDRRRKGKAMTNVRYVAMGMHGADLLAADTAADILIGVLGCTALLLGIVHLAWPRRVERIWEWLDNPKLPTLLRPMSVEAFPTRVAGILQVLVGALLLWYALLH